MTGTHPELLTQLNTLLRLTGTEAATARARVAQATTDATRRELTENAAACDERAQAIRTTIAEIGGVPDSLGLALGRAAIAARLPLEQTVPVMEALLADLALEHQLFDRARLVKVLAHSAQEDSAVQLAERLEQAHGSTIEWLFTVLAETALGGPAALAPTAVQAAATSARNTAMFATTTYVKGVNKAVSTAADLGSRVTASTSTVVSDGVERVRELAGSARRIATAGRNATLAETEKQAGGDAPATKSSVHALRENLGAVSASELPVPDFDTLTNKDAVAALRDLTTVEDIRVLLAYEQAHKARSVVVDAAEKRVREIATELVNS